MDAYPEGKEGREGLSLFLYTQLTSTKRPNGQRQAGQAPAAKRVFNNSAMTLMKCWQREHSRHNNQLCRVI